YRVLQGIAFEMDNPRRDSMMVTPIGICLSYYEQSNNFIFVEFNGKRVKLYDNGRLSVADAAVQSDFPNEELFPRRGTPLTFTVNGKSRMTRGIQGEAAVITLNGENADIYAQVHNGDHIQVTSSTVGEAAVLELGRLPELSERLHVYVNGAKIDLPKTAAVNGRMENEFYLIQEGDDIQIRNSYTVREIAEFMDVPLGGRILVNETPARPETRVYENFTLSWDVTAEITYADLEEETEEEAGKRRAAKEAAAAREIREAAQRSLAFAQSLLGGAQGEGRTEAGENPESAAETSFGENVETEFGIGFSEIGRVKGAETEAGNSGQGMKNISVIVNGYPVTLSGKEQYVFVDVFSFIDFDLNNPAGRDIVTNLNGRKAEYL
ncbi:MAG: cell division protein FtsA, partial [Acetatifactor sp.]|nr:cell division protein FtsA [Acetatifactor sp.]